MLARFFFFCFHTFGVDLRLFFIYLFILFSPGDADYNYRRGLGPLLKKTVLTVVVVFCLRILTLNSSLNFSN